MPIGLVAGRDCRQRKSPPLDSDGPLTRSQDLAVPASPGKGFALLSVLPVYPRQL